MLCRRIEVTFPLHFVYLFVQMYGCFFLFKLHQHNVLSSSIVCPTICMMQYYGTRAGIFLLLLSSFGFLSTFYQFSSWLWHLRFHTHTGWFDIKKFHIFKLFYQNILGSNTLLKISIHASISQMTLSIVWMASKITVKVLLWLQFGD